MEQRIVKARERDAKEAVMRRLLVENNILAGHGRSERRVEEMRRSRSVAGERRELFMDYSFAQAEQDKEKRARISQFEENLADELARRKAESLRQEMHKRRICDGSEELRLLKERLHAAKVNKERAQQLLEIEVKHEKDRLVEQRIAEHMANERLENIELEHKLNLEKSKQRERVKHINQQQIATKEAQRAEALAEYEKERQQVEELVQKIADEDAQEEAARNQKKEESKKQLQQFLVEQKAMQIAMEEAERLEQKKIEEFAKQKLEREEQLLREKEEADAKKAAILKAQLAVAERASKDKEELEQLRNDLHMEQLEAEARRREELQMRKRLEDREEMKRAYNFQMKMKEEKAMKLQEEEDKIRGALLAKFAEDDRLELMNEHKRRMKVEAHKREANRLMDIRRQQYEQARQQEREEEARLRDEEDKRHIIVEEERQRLLKEHAMALRDFLPKWTLETQEDYDMLNHDGHLTRMNQRAMAGVA